MARMPIRPAGDVVLARQSVLRDRSMRSPNHNFTLRVKPWSIVPFMIAPVLPGDTVKACSFNVRALSKPIKSRLMGWWIEQFFFYMRVGDFDTADQVDIKNILLGLDQVGGSGTGFNTAFYEANGKYHWMTKCYNRIVESYFRDESDTQWASWTDGVYHLARIGGPGGMFDSIADNDMLDDPIDPADAELWESKWIAYQQARNAKLTQATWPEYLAMQGVSTGPQLVEYDTGLRRPELCHYTRSWMMPVQAVEPSTGVPSALVQWAISDRWKKGRFCAEPGFLVGVNVARPKVTLKNQRANATGYMMDRPEAWMPTALQTDPHAAIRMFDGASTVESALGPAFGLNREYWLDPRDLLLRGDQFVNVDLGSTVSGALDFINLVDLPKIDGENGYINTSFPSTTDQDGLFTGNDKFIDLDGNCSLQIASRAGARDVTGRRGRGAV